MFQLIETIIAFSVIMLMLSFLVKSLTSVIKNHVDYYSRNLRGEVERLIFGYLQKGDWQSWAKDFPALGNIDWRRLSEEYLNRKNMEWILKRLSEEMQIPLDLKYLESRLEVHRANLKYAFETRTKNISLAVGMALCLFMNINALSIWQNLYNNEIIRNQLTSEKVLKQTETLYEAYLKEEQAAGAVDQKDKGKETQVTKEQLNEQLREVNKQLREFREQVPFGVGAIWRMPKEAATGTPPNITANKPGHRGQQKNGDSSPTPINAVNMLYEFFGSLLTGILVSIGAPYWHDLLRAMAALRPTPGNK